MVMLTLDGLEYQARYTNQQTAGSWKWMGLGSGSTAESSALTALTTEILDHGGERALATLTYEADYKSVWVKLFTFTGSKTIRECAIFNSITVAGSKMLMRHLFAADKSVVDTDTLQITMKLTQSA
jgi:hypothetical protein